MENTFYVPENATRFNYVVKRLQLDLEEIVRVRDIPEQEIRDYIKVAIDTAVAYEFKPELEMSFWQFDAPNHMPGDCRIPYVYMPTYYMVCIMMYAACNYEFVWDMDGFKETLYRGLNGAVGRKFTGDDWTGNEGLIEVMEIFAKAYVDRFVEKYPTFNEKFTNQFQEAMKHLKENLATGKVEHDWIRKDYPQLAQRVLNLYASDYRWNYTY